MWDKRSELNAVRMFFSFDPGYPSGMSQSCSVLLWHVHGSWTSAFVAGRHRYLLPVNDTGDEWGRGRCGRPWSDSVFDVPVDRAPAQDVDVVVLQRPQELELAEAILGRRLGRDVPAIYVEHNAPRPSPVHSVHPLADRSDIPVVHVTEFNRLMWDTGVAPTTVIPHGIADPGPLYTGSLPRAVTMINDPVRRGRVVGTDLLGPLAGAAPLDVFGMRTRELDEPTANVRGLGDVQGHELHREIARRRVYVHTARWTSLGLSLLEAMYLGMPVVAVATTEVAATVPPEVGVLSNDVDVLRAGISELVHEPIAAELAGKAARSFVSARHDLPTFLDRWDSALAAVLP